MAVKISSEDYYCVLGLKRNCSLSDIKKAYYTAALKCHPDRCASTASLAVIAENTARFQMVGRAYEVLSDAEMRAYYDATGKDPREITAHGDAYYTELFSSVSISDLDEFKLMYVGSEEERSDIVAAYNLRNGNVAEMVDDIFFASVHDEERFLAIISECIEDKLLAMLPGYADIISDPKLYHKRRLQRVKRAEKEAALAEKMAAKMKSHDNAGESDCTDLVSLIKNRQKDRHSDFVSQLEAKYTKTAKPRSSRVSKSTSK